MSDLEKFMCDVWTALGGDNHGAQSPELIVKQVNQCRRAIVQQQDTIAALVTERNALADDRDVLVDTLKQIIGPLRRGSRYIPTSTHNIAACQGLAAVGCMVVNGDGYQMNIALPPVAREPSNAGPISKGQFSRRLKAAARAAGATKTDQIEITFDDNGLGFVDVAVRLLVTGGMDAPNCGNSATLVANALAVEYIDGVAKQWGGVIAAVELSVCQKAGAK